AASRPSKRHPHAHAILHRPVLPGAEQTVADAGPFGHRRARLLFLAWQRARAAELHRACRHPDRRGHHSCPPSEPDVQGDRSTAGDRRQSLVSDRSLGHACRGIAKDIGRGGAPQDSGGDRRFGWRPRPGGRPPADELQDARFQAQTARDRVIAHFLPPGSDSYRLIPTRRSALAISFSVTSSTIFVAPTAVGSTKCRRPATIFLSWRIASITSAAAISATGGSGPRHVMTSASN